MKPNENQAMKREMNPRDRGPINGHTIGQLKRKINRLEKENGTLKRDLAAEQDLFLNYRKEVVSFTEEVKKKRI